MCLAHSGYGSELLVYYRRNINPLNSISAVLLLKYIITFYFYLSTNFEYFAEHFTMQSVKLKVNNLKPFYVSLVKSHLPEGENLGQFR